MIWKVAHAVSVAILKRRSGKSIERVEQKESVEEVDKLDVSGHFQASTALGNAAGCDVK